MIGYNVDLRWLLKPEHQEGIDAKVLRIGEKYEFTAEGHGVYPLEVPIHLIDDDWTAVASVMIIELYIGKGKTRGSYQVLRVYDDKLRQIISENL
jgi:hypothetical protein